MPDIVTQPTPGQPIDLLQGLTPASGVTLNADVRWSNNQWALIVVEDVTVKKIPADLVALRGLDVSTGTVAWTVPASRFDGTEPALRAIAFSGKTLVLRVMDWADHSSPDISITVDPATGELGAKSGSFSAQADDDMVGGVYVITDDTHVTGYSPSDLATPLWQQPSSDEQSGQVAQLGRHRQRLDHDGRGVCLGGNRETNRAWYGATGMRLLRADGGRVVVQDCADRAR